MICSDDFVYKNPARVEITIRNVAGELTDPSALRVEYRKPSDIVTTLWTYGVNAEVVRISVGRFYFNLANDEAGPWKWYWESDGVEAADQGSYRVTAKNV